MPVETKYDYISDLNDQWPLGSDLLKNGDDHIRGIKHSVVNTFPNVKGKIDYSNAELNGLRAAITPTSGNVAINKPIDMKQNRIGNVGSPTSPKDAIPLDYADSHYVNEDPTTGDVSVRGKLQVDKSVSIHDDVTLDINKGVRSKRTGTTPDVNLVSWQDANGSAGVAGVHVGDIQTQSNIEGSKVLIKANTDFSIDSAHFDVTATGDVHTTGKLQVDGSGQVNGKLTVGTSTSYPGATINANGIIDPLEVDGGSVIGRNKTDPTTGFINCPEFRSGMRTRGSQTGTNATPYGYASFYLQEQIGGEAHALITLNGFNTNRTWTFSRNGHFTLPLNGGDFYTPVGSFIGGSNGAYSNVGGKQEARTSQLIQHLGDYTQSNARCEQYGVDIQNEHFEHRLVVAKGNNLKTWSFRQDDGSTHCPGDLYLGGAHYYQDGNISGAAWGNGLLTAYLDAKYAPKSDERLKTDIVPSSVGAIDRICGIKTKEFKWNDQRNKDSLGREDRGFIAQDLAKIDPKYVFATPSGNNDGVEYLNISHTAIIADLIDSVKALKAEIEALKAGK